MENKLIEINKKIQRIEDKDVDYINNKKWQELRQEQEHLFYLFAINKINELKTYKDKYLYKIAEYQKFVDNYEKKH